MSFHKQFDKDLNNSDEPFFNEFQSKFNGPRSARSRSPFDNFEDFKKELEKNKKMFFDVDDSFGNFPSQPGFPFDEVRAPSTGGSGRRFVDDFASRHPMFAQRMRSQPWEDASFGPATSEFRSAGPQGQGQGRERHNSGGGASTCSSSAASASSSGSTGGGVHTNSGGEHIIPIRVVDKPEDMGNAQHKPKMGNNNNGVSGEPQSNGVGNCNEKEQQPPQKKYAQRNTTEIPIRSEPPSETGAGLRNARAHSAPPTSNDSQKVTPDIPPPIPEAPPKMNQFGGNSSKTEPPNPSPNQGNSGGGARRIPIIVEGRTTPMFTQEPPSSNEHQSHNESPNKPSRRAESSPTPPPKKPAPPLNPMEKIELVSNDVKELEKSVDEWTGTTRDKTYMYLDEMLTRNLIRLDDIDTDGREDVRQSRKDCIKLIQSCIAKLEGKIDGGQNNSMEVDGISQNGEIEDENKMAVALCNNANDEGASPTSTPPVTTPSKETLKEPGKKKKSKSPSPAKNKQ